MMALPHVPHEPFETGRGTSDPDGQMDWVLLFDFVPEDRTSSITNCQDTEHSGFGFFDHSNFEAASESYPFGTCPAASQVTISQHHTVDPKLLSQQDWVSSQTDSTSSSFGSHTSTRENNSSTSSAGTHSTNSSLSFHNKQIDAFNTLHPNKRRYCELPMDAPATLPNQAHVVYPVSTLNEAPEQEAIAIFECWLSTCPYVYPENSEFENLAALTKLDAVVVKSWFAKQLRARHMDDSMFETWLCSYPLAYPGDEEFRNLSALTRLSLDTVRQWFAQKLRFKGSGIHHNNASPAVGNSGKLIDPPLHFNTPIVSITQQPSLLERAASWVREERGTKCIATHDQSLLLRDDNKPYQCTRKCGKKFRDRDDWRKHEEVNWPQEGWICDLSATITIAGIQICTHCGVPNPTMDHFQTHKKSICNNKGFAARGRLHHRKQHFLQHFDNVHPHVPGDDFVRNSHFLVNSNFPRRCGFCQHRFIHWKNRVEHIGAHFHDDEKDMTEWRDHLETEDQSANQGKDRRNDDDDDSDDDASDSSDDDSDGAPPPSRPKRRNRTKSSRPQGRPETTALDPNNINQQWGMLMFDKSFGHRFTDTFRERKTFKRYLQDSGFHSRGEAAKRVEEWTSFQLFDNSFIATPYTRIRILGCGPYSVVDEVQNLATGAIFARKTINYPNEEESTSFLTEIEIMKKLAHPHIVQFIDTYTLDKSVSILMSPVANFDLGCYMSKHQSLELIPMKSVIQWFSCLASSVEYLHSKLIKHQDIKPSNILIKGRTIFLSDFGISKVFEGTDSTASTSGDLTWKYSSPETAQHGLRGRKADIFSLGCVFLEMFSFLIFKGHRDFNHFKEHHFVGNGSYQENLPMVKIWIENLRRESDVKENLLLQQLLDSWAPMLEQSSKNRPSAADLSVILPPGKCCPPALDDILNSQPAVNDIQTVSLVGNRPTTQHNSPQFSLLDDQKRTVNKLASQTGLVLNTGSQSSRYKMPDRPRALKLCGDAMTNRTSWSHCFALFSILMTFLSVLLMPAFDPAIFEPQMPIGGSSPYTNQTSLPESYIAAGDAVVGTYFSAPATEMLQAEDNPLSDGGKISIKTEVKEVDWLLARYLEQTSARTDTLLVSLEWYGSPSMYFRIVEETLKLDADTPFEDVWKFSLLRHYNNLWTWMYYHDRDSQWREFSLIYYGNHLWKGGSTNPRGLGPCRQRGLGTSRGPSLSLNNWFEVFSGFNTSKPTTESLKNHGDVLTNYCLGDYTSNCNHLATLNIPAIAGIPSYDSESIAGTTIFNRLVAKWFDWAVYQEMLGEFGVTTCFGLGLLLFHGIWSGYIFFLAISEIRIAIPSAFQSIARDTVTVSLKLAIAFCTGIGLYLMIILTAALREANDLDFIQIFGGITWLYIVALMTETASLRGQWPPHVIPGLSRFTRKGDPHTSQALGQPRDWNLRNTDDHDNTAYKPYLNTKPKGYSRRTAEIDRITRSLMRWVPIGTALFASRLVVLHVTNHNWLSLILSKLCFASDITDGVFRFEIIMAMFKSIIAMSLATILGSLVTIVLANHIPRHLGLIWSSLVLAMFFIFRIWAHDLTLFLLHVVLIAANNALIHPPLQSKFQNCISFSVKYLRLRLFLCLFLWSLLEAVYYVSVPFEMVRYVTILGWLKLWLFWPLMNYEFLYCGRAIQAAQ